MTLLQVQGHYKRNMQKIISIFIVALLVYFRGASSSMNKRISNNSPISVSMTGNMSSDSLNGLAFSPLKSPFYRDESKITGGVHYFNSETLIRLYEGATEGREQLKEVLMEQIKSKSNDEIVEALYYSYINGYPQAYLAIIESIQVRLKDVVEVFESVDIYPKEFLEDLKRFCTEFGTDEDYIFIENFDIDATRRPFLDINEFMHLEAHLRLPAAIRKILELPVADNDVTSNFIANNVLANRFDLWTILVLYEIEMMDVLHLHDTKGVIERYLKRVILFEKNEEMAKLAHQMYINSYFHALKMIIDEKFSYESPLKNPFWFQDLYFLFQYAKDNYFSASFNLKVIELSKPCAIRYYVSKVGLTAANF